jgi:hypothetical protein
LAFLWWNQLKTPLAQGLRGLVQGLRGLGLGLLVRRQQVPVQEREREGWDTLAYLALLE